MNISRYFKTIIWSFLGLRKKSEMEKDFKELNILYVIIFGVASCLLFVMGLIVIVSFVVS